MATLAISLKKASSLNQSEEQLFDMHPFMSFKALRNKKQSCNLSCELEYAACQLVGQVSFCKAEDIERENRG
eukprot:5970399-Amphidinium_carterae.1